MPGPSWLYPEAWQLVMALAGPLCHMVSRSQGDWLGLFHMVMAVFQEDNSRSFKCLLEPVCASFTMLLLLHSIGKARHKPSPDSRIWGKNLTS